MIRALLLSFNQLGDRAVLAVLAKSILITLVLFAALGALLVWGARALVEAQGWGADAGLAAATAAALAGVLGAWLLFRAVAVPVMGVFADEVVAAIERKHYPDAAGRARPAGLALSIRMGLASLSRVMLFNLLALPAYVLLLFTAIGPVILFVAINAVLLGRDLGEMVAVRHMDRGALEGWLRGTRGTRALLGLVVTGLFLLPVVNLVAPILGAAMATHIFHGQDA